MNVGIIIIGNEILSGSVADVNSTYLAAEIFAAGASLLEIATVPDVSSAIAEKVKEFSERFDLVFTTGGIGPTHDDITYEAIALAFGRATYRHPELERIGREFKREVTPAVLKLITVPEGARPLPSGDFIWPPMMVENVVMLPGIPSLIEKQKGAWRPLLPDTPFVVREVKAFCRETALARAAGDTARDHPEVELGSYPKIQQRPHYVLLRFTGRDKDKVDFAVQHFLTGLPAEVRTEG